MTHTGADTVLNRAIPYSAVCRHYLKDNKT